MHSTPNRNGDVSNHHNNIERFETSPLSPNAAAIAVLYSDPPLPEEARGGGDDTGDEEQRRDEAVQAKEASSSFWQLYRPCIILVVWYLLFNTGSDLVVPFLPHMQARRLGGNRKAAAIQSYADFASAFVALLITPWYGYWMDTRGRRPFFILASLLQVVWAVLIVLIGEEQVVACMVTYAIANIAQTSFLFAQVSDVYSSKMRPRMMACVTSAMFVPLALDAVTPLLGKTESFLVGLGAQCGALVFAVLFVPETLSPEDAERNRQRMEMRRQRAAAGGAGTSKVEKRTVGDDLTTGLNNSSGTSIQEPNAANDDTTDSGELSLLDSVRWLSRNRVVSLCTVIICFHVLAEVGSSDVFLYFAADKVNFDSDDNAYTAAELGGLSLVTNVVLLPFLLRRYPPVRIVLFTLVLMIAELIILAVLWAQWPVFALFIPLTSVVTMGYPVCVSVVQNAVSKEDQGRIMTALSSMLDLATAVGPLFFGILFGYLPNNLSFVPFVACAAVCIPAICICVVLDRLLASLKKSTKTAPS